MSLLGSDNYGFGGLGLLGIPVKRKVFISYHHANDQFWYDYISTYYSDSYDLFHDNSLDRKIDSTNATYLDRTIRDNYIFGTSVTIVLCGPETWKRRWVDWEIYATLHQGHGLLGVALPTCAMSREGKYVVPDRLHKNIQSGYAEWLVWDDNPDTLKRHIESAYQKSSSKSMIQNNDQKMMRSLS